MLGLCPLYPQKRTLELSCGMSALCQKQAYALQHEVAATQLQKALSHIADKPSEAAQQIVDVAINP